VNISRKRELSIYSTENRCNTRGKSHRPVTECTERLATLKAIRQPTAVELSYVGEAVSNAFDRAERASGDSPRGEQRRQHRRHCLMAQIAEERRHANAEERGYEASQMIMIFTLISNPKDTWQLLQYAQASQSECGQID
jgi:hypothetical protein